MKFELPKIIDFGTKNADDVIVPKGKSPEDLYGNLKPILVWEAASRGVTKIRESRFSRSSLIVGIFIGLILLMIREYYLIIMVASILFFIYATSKTEPETARYEINSHGFMYDAKQYYWHQLRYFFFKTSGDMNLLCIDTNLGVPGRIFVNIGSESEKKITEILSERIKYLEIEPKDRLAQTYEKVMDKFNLD